MPTIIKSSKEQAWIGVPSVETWISCPLLNAIPLKNFYIELMLIFVYKISSSTNNNLSVTMFGWVSWVKTTHMVNKKSGSA